MPELPEVETTRRGIAPYVLGQIVERVVVREPRLRWRVPMGLQKDLPGQTIRSVTRRGKYLLLETTTGHVIIHLGMSGSLRLVDCKIPAEKSDHVDLALTNGNCLRLRDPRRFGAVLWTHDDPAHHKLLRHLGPEPLGREFDGAYLHAITRRRKRSIRDLLLDSRLVAGVGNIYANEALFEAGLRPGRAAGRLTRAQCERLVQAIKSTLKRALRAGGTTLRDFRNGRGEPGYFQLTLKVYGRAGKPCLVCGSRIHSKRPGQRSMFYCANCQL